MVTGGAGYVGSVLVPLLLEKGHRVTVLDLFLYGTDVLDGVKDHANLRLVAGDLRSRACVEDALTGCDAVIHLACISNDPSFDLDPELGKSINYDAFTPLVEASKAAGIELFIYASSSSVYGIKSEPEVTEDLSLEPLTDYSKYKALCEAILEEARKPGFATCIIRPSTVCGYGPRQRLDVIVNILTNFAYNKGHITVFGGSQKRPNIHIKDMAGLYAFLLEQPLEKIDGKVFNAGYENYTLMELAHIVRSIVGPDIPINVEKTDDLRSYHVSSERMRRELGFEPTHSVEDAVRDLVSAFKDGRLANSMDDPRFSNIKLMKSINLK